MSLALLGGGLYALIVMTAVAVRAVFLMEEMRTPRYKRTPQ